MGVVAVFGLAAAIASRAPTAPAAPTLPSLEEGLSVREVELVLEPPVGKGLRDAPDPGAPVTLRVAVPPLEGQGDLRPADLLVLEDGKARPVLRLEPLAASAPHPWTLRIYFDLVLGLPDTVFDAAIALAYQADQLTQLGAVEIVVADPEPHTTLAASRDGPAIKEALAALAAQVRRDPRAKPFSPPPPLTMATVRRQCDRMITALAGAAVVGPHALLLIAEPPRLSPAELHLLKRVSTAGAGSAGRNGGSEGKAATPGDPGDGQGRALGETARLLAAYGWVTVALPIHRLQGSREAAPEDDNARFRRQNVQGPQPSQGISLVGLIMVLVQLVRGKPLQLHPPDTRQVAAQVGMENLSLAEMVRPTAGFVVSNREALAPALGTLAARWHLWYQADAAPAGREQPVTVSLLANAHEVRAPRWVRSSIPESLAAARLRRNLDGDSLPGPLPVSATAAGAAAAAPASSIVLAQAAPATGSATSTAGPLRVSFAWTDARDGVRVSHRVLDAGAAELWNHRHYLSLEDPRPSPGNQVMAVLMENLASEVWGCAVVAASPESSDGRAAVSRRFGAR